MNTLTLTEGFPIEHPRVTISWGLSQRCLVRLLGPHGLRKVNANYYVISCTSLSGLSHELGFHYDTGCRRSKFWLEFFRKNGPDVKESYDEFQHHLKLTFGQPTVTGPAEEGFLYHHWEIGDHTVSHTVYERFVLSNHVAIRPQNDGQSLAARLFDAFQSFCWPAFVLLLPLILALVILILHRMR